jgi:uncharacterized DUF497 family protein
MRFRWNDWNIEHIDRHDVSPREAEYVVQNARRPYPQRIDERKWLVIGQTASGRFLQVIFLLEPEKTAFVIHSRELSDMEKRRYRRRIR